MRPVKLLTIYDVPGWACESETKALTKHLNINAPGRFAITSVPSYAIPNVHQFDVVFSTIYYQIEPAVHPKSVSQVSAYDYWVRKGWEGGWPHLAKWKYMVAKNKDIFARLTPEDHPRIQLLYHPFDHDFWTPGPSTSRDDSVFTIGFAGHRQYIKGLHLLEEAVTGLSGVRLLAPTYEKGRIPPDKMPDFYRSLDVYVCMSEPHQDAGPRSPVEAGLCGIPVITTRSGQIGEMVEDGVTGLVIDRTVEALRSALTRLQADHALRQSMAAEIRQRFMTRWVMDVGAQWTDYLLRVAGE